MKTKQSSELAAVDTLDAAIEVGRTAFFEISPERPWLQSTSEGRAWKWHRVGFLTLDFQQLAVADRQTLLQAASVNVRRVEPLGCGSRKVSAVKGAPEAALKLKTMATKSHSLGVAQDVSRYLEAIVTWPRCHV